MTVSAKVRPKRLTKSDCTILHGITREAVFRIVNLIDVYVSVRYPRIMQYDHASDTARHSTHSIRDLCEEFDVTPRALRFYESQELLAPQRDGQRRIYSARDRARLQLILRGKRFGFSLSEIREHLDLYDLGDGQVAQLSQTVETARVKLKELKDKRQDIDDAIQDLTTQLDYVEQLLEKRRHESGIIQAAE